MDARVAVQRHRGKHHGVVVGLPSPRTMNALIEHLRTRGPRDRRSRSAWTYVSVGIAIGVCLASPMAVSAQGFQEWTKPPVLMSIIGLIVSVGMAWQMVQEDRRRIALLETDTVKKENLV